MTYATGNINSANPGPALEAAIETHLLAAGFTLVDTVTISTRTHKVFESAAANNTLGLDWYLDVSYTTTGAAFLMFTPFEDYDASTDLGYRGPYSASNSTLDGTTYSRFGATGQTLESWASTTAYSLLGQTLPASTTFGWWLSATTDRVIFMSTIAASELHYAGFYEPTAAHEAHAGASMYPLVRVRAVPAASQTSNSSASLVTAALTRVPKLSAIAWATHVLVNCNQYTYSSGQVGTADSAATGESSIAACPVIMGASTTTPGASLVGFLKDVGVGFCNSGVVRGDTATLDGDTWIALTPSSTSGMFFKAA